MRAYDCELVQWPGPKFVSAIGPYEQCSAAPFVLHLFSLHGRIRTRSATCHACSAYHRVRSVTVRQEGPTSGSKRTMRILPGAVKKPPWPFRSIITSARKSCRFNWTKTELFQAQGSPTFSLSRPCPTLVQCIAGKNRQPDLRIYNSP